MHQVSVARPGLSQHQDVVSGKFSIPAPFVFCAVVCKDERRFTSRETPLWVCLSGVTMVRRLSPQPEEPEMLSAICSLLQDPKPPPSPSPGA